MQALFELTEGKKCLQAIVDNFPIGSPYWNEAQNRFQFVDRLLLECLGWERPNIEVERSDDLGGRADYLLGVPPAAVVEAKREAGIFDVPPASKKTIVRKIESLLNASKKFDEAVRQVIPYCAVHGAQIAIICNGPQMAIFQALIPGHSPLQGECYLFDGFESYLENFAVLWKLLSPEGISENRAYIDLGIHRSPRIPLKASTVIAEPQKYRYRNNFQENLRSLSSLLLEVIEDDPNLKSDFYEECYVPIEANNRHLLLSKNIIASRYKRAGDGNVEPPSLEETTKIGRDGGVQFTDPSFMGVAGSRPIVVIGDVGVGKTSFFEKLYENLEAGAKAHTYFININLGIKASLAKDIKSYVLAEIPAVLKVKYEIDINTAEFANAIYHQDLIDFDRSVKGGLKHIDPAGYQNARIEFLDEKIQRRDAHLQASLGHLARGRNKQIVLVLDNADQRSFEVQQDTFLIAQELSASRNLLVFVALRPSTFYVSKTKGALSAYQNKVLTISPPPADEVIQKRLIFAARVAEGKVAPLAIEGIRLHLGSVVLFIKAALRSIRDSEPIQRFLSNITGGNTRSVIELITSFFGSPNVDSQKIIRLEEESGRYKIPLHEFTKHALLGDYAYFNSQSSLVACNVFDVSLADPREHFLACLAVSFLSSNSGLLDQDGFLTGKELLNEMRRHNFVEEQIRYAMKKLASKRLIETPFAHYREIPVLDHEPPEQFHFRATSVGIYHMRYWIGSFSFLDAVSTDTPIFDEGARGKVAKLAGSLEIRDRYEKATTFRNYLRAQWHVANFNSPYYDFLAILQEQDEGFQTVNRVISRP